MKRSYMQFKDGLHECKVHGTTKVFLIKENEFFIPDYERKKKRWSWVGTIMCPDRAKMMRPVDPINLVDRINNG